MQNIPARYYDGATSIPHEVTVIVTAVYLEIIFSDRARPPVVWKVSEIKKDNQLQKKYLRLLYGNYPFEILELDPAVTHLLMDFPSFREVIAPSWYAKTIRNKKMVFGMFFSFIAAALAIYFIVIPALIRPIVNRIPLSYEIQLGNSVFKSLTADEEIDREKTAWINRFWKSMGYETEYPVEITVIKSDMINAFALPGGHIVVFDSILQLVENSDQLAGLLSHEYIHVRNRHSMYSLVSSYSNMILIQLFAGNMNSTASSIFENASMFKTLKYTRKLEKEADEEGMQLMYEHQIDPAGMSQLFQQLEDAEKENHLGEIPEYLASHPVLKNRVKYSQHFAKTHAVDQKDSTLTKLFREL